VKLFENYLKLNSW